MFLGLVVAIMMTHMAVQGAEPMGTAFTYQGQLKKDGLPVTHTRPGSDFTFRLFDDAAAGRGDLA